MSFQFSKRVHNAISISSMPITKELKQSFQFNSPANAAPPAPLISEETEDGEAYASDVDNLVYIFAPEGNNDAFQYTNNENFDPTSSEFVYMYIFIDEVPVTIVCYTIEREGTPFTYLRGGVFYRGVFTNGEVYFTSSTTITTTTTTTT